MGNRIEIWVPGVPKPGGSKRAFAIGPRGREKRRPDGSLIINMIDASDNADWKANCAHFGQQAMGDRELFNGTLQVEVTFILPRTKAHCWTGKRANVLRDDAPKFHTNAPDATKLMRSTEDALTGICWNDDKIIARQFVQKVYGEKTGARIVITQLTDNNESSIEQRAAGDGSAPMFELAGVEQ